MRAKILDKSEEDKWWDFVNKHPLGTIHQTPCWGRFQAKIPARGKYWIVVLEEDEKIVGGTMLIRHKLAKKYCWLYASRGPLLDYENEENFKFQKRRLLETIKEIAKREKAGFLRVDPPIIEDSQKVQPFKELKETSHGFHPEHTLIIDLTKSEDSILRQMKQKGRYNIRLAEKKEVKIRKTKISDPEALEKDLNDFYLILKETTKRDKFSPHKKEYYKQMLETLQPEDPATGTTVNGKNSPGNVFSSPKTELYLARYEGRTIAGIIVTFYKDTAIYYYGASSNEHRNLMAPYLLQWHAMKEAKKRGCEKYDLLGISPPKTPDTKKPHPWQGVTAFKKKFGGTHVSYIPATEHPFKKSLYLMYRLYKKLR